MANREWAPPRGVSRRAFLSTAVTKGVAAAVVARESLAAPITAAVHHATGVRVRELPVKIEHLLV
jgi:CO/xanthine dehydrogenase Mo-binding subunit